MKRRFDRNKSVHWFLTGLMTLFLSLPAMGGIPEPPIFIVGNLETPGGLPVTSGTLRFDFTPTGGGTTVSVEAFVGAFTDDIQFFAFIPLERAPVENPAEALVFDSAVTYNVTAFYNGAQINKEANKEAKLLTSPYTPARADLIGPLAVMVSPTGPQVSVSPSLEFGFVQQGSQAEKGFMVYNVGTAAFTGTARTEQRTSYNVIEGGVPVNEAAVNLDAGQTLAVTIRYAPTVTARNVQDVFQVRTTGGDQDRNVSGSSIIIRTGNPDIDENGVVDKNDLYLLLLSWYYSTPGIPKPQADLNIDDIINHPDLARLLAALKN
jgi:hypothetical protein